MLFAAIATLTFATASSPHAGDVTFNIMDLNVTTPSIHFRMHMFFMRKSICRKQPGLTFMQDLSSVAAFAAAYPLPTLDVLICNAGIMNTPFALSKVVSSQSILIR